MCVQVIENKQIVNKVGDIIHMEDTESKHLINY